ncbi:dihydrolipoyl dehydrogenase [bacterium]|nr:dihydrolipoyl dehydrogenase [bacterium]
MRIGIIGGGSGGYVAAIRAAQLGAEVTVFEKDKLGGTCTNYGCIPTKALYSVAHKMLDFKWGVSKKMWTGEISPDWRMVQNFKNGVVARLVRGIEFLFKKNKIVLVRGEAQILSSNEILVEGTKGAEKYEFDKIILATGSSPGIPPVEELVGIAPWDNVEALAAERLPKSLLILGGGVIGVEFAHIFRTFGSDVTIVELLPRILPLQDVEVAAAVDRALIGEGVKIMTSQKAVSAHRSKSGVILEIADGSTVGAEEIIVATGRKVNLPKGAENIGLTIEQNRIPVNKYRQTASDNVYAVGDITGEPYLEHKATREGIIAVEHIMGIESELDIDLIPAAIFTALEVGAAGYTEKQAREKFGDNIKIGKFPYIASGRAQAEGEPIGFIKTIAVLDGTIIGFHAVGKTASELLGLGGFIIQHKIKIDDVAGTIFAHPTLSEIVQESALAAIRRAIHI